jgi:hypothetical protein
LNFAYKTEPREKPDPKAISRVDVLEVKRRQAEACPTQTTTASEIPGSLGRGR